jgi:crotonobetainyl-CoA:carnitine CoA-transferase CaiB-like acyl-CoA transferase
VPSATFRCADGKYAHITASDQHWEPLCAALQIGTVPIYATNAARVAHREEVMALLTPAVARLTRAELIARLDAADVPVGPVNDVAEVLADPQVRARGMVGSFDYAGVGEFRALALPYKFLGWDDPAIGAPPALGEHTEAILRERLGYSDERIAALRQEKAI